MIQTEIILIRHGETEWNLSGRWQGHGDSALTERGIAQAESLGKTMVDEKVDAAYSSDLLRATHTASLIGTPAGLSFAVMPELRERDVGALQGLTVNEMLSSHPHDYQGFLHGGPDFEVSDGESFRAFFDRCCSAIDRIATRHKGQKIVVVTHGGVLGAVFRYVLKIPLEAKRNFVLLNASINRVVLDADGHWSLLSWGDVAHLKGLDSLDDS